MSDENIQALKRAWNEQGTIEAEVSLIGALVQGGELEIRRVNIAALCNYTPALNYCQFNAIEIAPNPVIKHLETLKSIGEYWETHGLIALICELFTGFGTNHVKFLKAARKAALAPFPNNKKNVVELRDEIPQTRIRGVYDMVTAALTGHGMRAGWQESFFWIFVEIEESTIETMHEGHLMSFDYRPLAAAGTKMEVSIHSIMPAMMGYGSLPDLPTVTLGPDENKKD